MKWPIRVLGSISLIFFHIGSAELFNKAHPCFWLWMEASGRTFRTTCTQMTKCRTRNCKVHCSRPQGLRNTECLSECRRGLCSARSKRSCPRFWECCSCQKICWPVSNPYGWLWLREGPGDPSEFRVRSTIFKTRRNFSSFCTFPWLDSKRWVILYR